MKSIAVVLVALAVMADATLVLTQTQSARPQPSAQGGTPSAGRPGAAAPQGGRQGRGGVQGGGARQARGAQAAGTAVIQGRVVAAETGTPVRRATVQATSAGAGRPQSATTDADGRFELRGLPAGAWRISASKTGFVTQQHGQRRPFEAVEPTTLADGQRLAANFSLARGGAITGRVFDEFGDPLVDARVQAFKSQTVTVGPAGSRGPAGGAAREVRRLAAVGRTAQTDDTGAFRLYGLGPGAYYVVATPGALPVTNAPADGDLGRTLEIALGRVRDVIGATGSSAYAPTFFPGTLSATDAQRISLAPGEEQPNVNFTVIPARPVRVSGTVLGSTGAPIQATLTLREDSAVAAGLSRRYGASAGADGTFSIGSVLPGTYVLQVNARVPRGASSPEVAATPITVTTDDMTGITVVTGRGATVSGSVATDNGVRLPFNDVQIAAQALREGSSQFGRLQVSNAGTFELTGLLGPYAFRVDPPDGWGVRSITANGVDVTDRPIDLRSGDQVAVRIVLTDRLTELTGTARSGGQAAPGASIVVFPEDPAKWGTTSRYLRTARADGDGAFRIRALPSGERYAVVAVEYLEEGEYLDPEFLQRMKAQGLSLSLSEGEQRRIDVAVSER